MSETPEQALRRLPAVNDVLAELSAHAGADGLAHEIVVGAVRDSIEECRAEILAAPRDGKGASPEARPLIEEVVDRCRQRIERLRAPHITSAINATGILIHTGMGRSPLAEEALKAVVEVSGGYCDVAISKKTGGRRNRSSGVEEILKSLTGCEAALVANNNAAAVLLALAAHAEGREVVVSRGQLVEIGGSFRLPDVMASAGVRLREVGTTNRTRLSDYARAIGEETAALMRIHPSNFRVVGFTETVEIGELAGLAHDHGLIVIDDVGSGALIDLTAHGLHGETMARDSIGAGADLTLFSADKLLGGPQAGVLIGTKRAVGACAKHPLMRALRVDKMTMAALEATLRLYLEPARLGERLPLIKMIAQDSREVRRRAQRLRRVLKKNHPELQIAVVEDVAYVGGGSLPEESLPSWTVVIADLPGEIEPIKERLRLGEPSVFARVRHDRLELDMRTVRDRDVVPLAGAIGRCL